MGAKKIDWLNDPDVEQYWTIYQFNRQWVYTMWPTNASFLFYYYETAVNISGTSWSNMSYFTVLLFSSYELFHITFIYVHTNILIIIFLHQTNNTNICISDSQYNVSDHVSAHQPQNKNSLDKVYHEKYGVNYRSYFRNNLPLKKDRILISKLFSQIINLQWILQVKINPAKCEWHCNWKRKGFGLNLDVPF